MSLLYLLDCLSEFIKNHSLSILNIGALLALLILCVLFYYKHDWRRKVVNHLMGYAIGVFFMGIILYSIGFWHEGTENNIVATVFRSIIASMEMFVSESELIEVQLDCKKNHLYMLLFSVTHFFAVCISAAFIIHILGIRFRSYFNMRFSRKNCKDVFIFFDLSQESISLAKDIYRTKKNGIFQIVFVKTPMREEHLERFSFSHILNLADSRNEIIEELVNIDAFLTYSKKTVTIGMDENEWENSVGLNNLRRYLKKCSGKKYFFCLSSNEENNINTAVALSKHYHNTEKHRIYCHANQNCITESFANSNLYFINSANLAVLELKKNVIYQPVSYVKPDIKTGVATKPFRAMIIGFGATGLEVFRFLYEFSAFVGKDMEENPFYCDIIDPKAKQLEDSLYLYCPDLELSKKNARGGEGESINKITFHEGRIETNRNKVIELIKILDYIVVCTNNGKDNLSIGVTLLDLAYKYRKYSDKLNIFIGVNDNREYNKAKEIARYYNECGQKDKDNHFYEFYLTPFGAMINLFTYKNIIDDEMLEKAKDFYYEYQRTSGLLDVKYKSDCATDKETEWENRRKDKDLTGEMGVSNRNELTQKEFQDMANVWHMQTKLQLVGALGHYSNNSEYQYMVEKRREELCHCINTVMQKLITKVEYARSKKESFVDSYQFIQDQIKEYEIKHNIPIGEYQTLFANLAKCEHLRWNASNRMLGYRTNKEANGNQKHYLQKTHACMVSNKELILDEKLRDTIKYDYNTILVTLNK